MFPFVWGRKCTYAGEYSSADILDVRLKVEMKKIRPFYYAQIWKNVDFTGIKEKYKPFPTGTKTNKLVDTNQ